MASTCFSFIFSFILASNVLILASDDKNNLQDDKLHYKKGSVCSYCKYCRFCELCSSCPCSGGPGKPNCHMCKYCKYCYLCSAFCDTICTPGGVIDTVSSALLSNIPFHEEDAIKEDLETVKSYVNKRI